MATDVRDSLLWQLEIAWKLATYHLNSLTTEECLWRPSFVGLHVWKNARGEWVADWPEQETYDIGPPSIAWVTWHMGFWWSMVLDHSFGTSALRREDVLRSGGADATRAWLGSLHSQWLDNVQDLPVEDVEGSRLTRWPFQGRPFRDVVAWANLELAKNAAEIGYARFLYASRSVVQQSVPGDAPASRECL